MNRGSLSTFMLITISYRCDLSSIETLRFFYCASATEEIVLSRSEVDLISLKALRGQEVPAYPCRVLIDREDLSY